MLGGEAVLSTRTIFVLDASAAQHKWPFKLGDCLGSLRSRYVNGPPISSSASFVLIPRWKMRSRRLDFDPRKELAYDCPAPQRLGCMYSVFRRTAPTNALTSSSFGSEGVAFLNGPLAASQQLSSCPSIAPFEGLCSDAPATLMVSVFFDMSFRDLNSGSEHCSSSYGRIEERWPSSSNTVRVSNDGTKLA